MAGKDNDASVYTVFRLIPNSNGYDRHIVYMESIVGGHTGTQATRIRQIYEDYDCDYIVLDTQSIGLGVYDALCQPLYDKERAKNMSHFHVLTMKEWLSVVLIKMPKSNL